MANEITKDTLNKLEAVRVGFHKSEDLYTNTSQCDNYMADFNYHYRALQRIIFMRGLK